MRAEDVSELPTAVHGRADTGVDIVVLFAVRREDRPQVAEREHVLEFGSFSFDLELGGLHLFWFSPDVPPCLLWCR